MPEQLRIAAIAVSLLFCVCAAYYRARSLASRESLDRTKEGWPTLISLRPAGILTLVLAAICLAYPGSLAWAAVQVPETVRWIAWACYTASLLWLVWMFRSLGHNLTDTVVTRRNSTFVRYGPYRYVRNPMYTGVLATGLSFGFMAGTWLIPLLATLVFTLLALRTRTEEKFLTERFGSEYRDYMQRVGRFFPRLRSR